jgi:hypothetical protein
MDINTKGTNNDIEFEFSDEEMRIALTSIERDAMKKIFKDIDKSDYRSNVFRIVTKFTLAAVFTGLIFGSAFLVFSERISNFNTTISKVDSNKNTNQINRTLKLNNLREEVLVKNDLVRNSTSIIIPINELSSLETINDKFDSVEVNINYLNFELDELNKSLDALAKDKESVINTRRENLKEKIKIIELLNNTYTYNDKLLTLNLKYSINLYEIGVANRKEMGVTKTYLNFNKQYYEISKNIIPQKLDLLTNKDLINKIEENMINKKQ